jgi:anti-anti-sigma factor
MNLTLISSENNVKRLRCEGTVTPADFVSDANPFTRLLGADCFSEKVLVSLEHTSLVDTAGIGWLVMSHKRFQEQGGKLVLHSIPPMVDHVFRLLHMPRVLHMAANESAAQELIRGDQR